MIGKLKVECGNNIVNRIVNMFQDISISKTLMEEFRNGIDEGTLGGVDLQVQVLRNGCWPNQKVEMCTIPQELLPCKTRFESFYAGKQHGRALNWQLGFGQCELTTAFIPKHYTLIVSPYQAAILLLFNRQPILNLNQIREITNLSDKTVKAHLINFFNPKNRLLTKHSKGKNLEETDEFSECADFTCSTLRVNFTPMKGMKEDIEEKTDDKAVEQERKNVVDSAIVRIAKSRRTINHQELLIEVMKQVTYFRAQDHQIAEQIKSLIQREYLKQDEHDRTLYIYIP
jgi:cullin-4